MSTFELQPDFLIKDAGSLRNLYEPTHAVALQKQCDTLCPNAREFIRRSPFLCIGTQGN